MLRLILAILLILSITGMSESLFMPVAEAGGNPELGLIAYIDTESYIDLYQARYIFSTIYTENADEIVGTYSFYADNYNVETVNLYITSDGFISVYYWDSDPAAGVSTPVQTIQAPLRPSTASVSLYGEKTDVELGENILLKLSAVSLITKPKMHVQVIIIPPSGMSVTSSEFVKSGAEQYTTTYELEPGNGRDIEVRIMSNQVGKFKVTGRIVYYFGDDVSSGEDHTQELTIKVRPEGSSLSSGQTQAGNIPGTGLFGLNSGSSNDNKETNHEERV